MLIEITDLSFSYGAKPVLSGITVKVAEGERWAIIGKNGAGKSTLIRCMAGLEPQWGGEIRIRGKVMRQLRPRELSKLMAYVPQAQERILPYRVLDYAMMGRFPYQGFMAIASKEDRRIVENALSLTDCAELSSRSMSTLSGGELQRVFLAAAVSQRTEIMLLDEPATFLDPLHQSMIQRALDRVHDEFRTTMITVTHDINTALANNDRVLALVDGKLFYAGGTAEFLGRSPRILREVFGISFDDGVISGTGRRVVMPHRGSSVIGDR